MSIRKALSFSYLEKYGSYVVGFISTIILSRILGPAEIGSFSVGMALVGIIAVLREMGISAYVVQEEALTEPRIRAAFTLTAGAGLALALVVLGLSGPAAAFYKDPRVGTVLEVLALGFALTPFGSVAQNLMLRDREFGTLTAIRLLCSVVAAVAAVLLAGMGFGPVSLAWATVAAAATNAAISTWARPHSHRPNFERGDLRRVLRVGAPATATAIVDDIAASLPELMLGRFQSLGAAGLFSRARGLSDAAYQIVARGAGPVLFAEYAARNRENQGAAPVYVKSTQIITLLGWTMLGTIAVLAEEIVRVLFGSQWGEVVPILRWLCISASIFLLSVSAFHVLIALGRADVAMRAKLAWLPIHVVCLLIGAAIGAEALAAGLVVSIAANTALLCIAVRRHATIMFSDHFAIVTRSAPIALLAIVSSTPALLLPHETLLESLTALCVGGLGSAIGFVGGLYVSGHPLREEVARALGFLRNKL